MIGAIPFVGNDFVSPNSDVLASVDNDCFWRSGSLVNQGSEQDDEEEKHNIDWPIVFKVYTEVFSFHLGLGLGLAVETVKSAIRCAPIRGSENKGDAIAFAIAEPDGVTVGKVEVILKQNVFTHMERLIYAG